MRPGIEIPSATNVVGTATSPEPVRMATASVLLVLMTVRTAEKTVSSEAAEEKSLDAIIVRKLVIWLANANSVGPFL